MADASTFSIKPFGALTLRELHACFKLRSEVFVVGQRICELSDIDGDDPLCHHAMLWLGDRLVATARLLPKDGGRVIKVGRVAVDGAFRGRGLGIMLMRGVQDWITAEPGRTGVMSAQAYLERWYAALGWCRQGEVYIEAGIDHVAMAYDPASHPAD